MIVDERYAAYVNSLDSGNTPLLDEIEQKALAEKIPVVRKETQSFLKWLLAVKRPERILEVGTAVGFSALLMAEYDPVRCRILTVENDAGKIPQALGNIRRAGREEQIEVLEGDAADILRKLEDPFGLIFMDAAKGQYLNFMDDAVRLLEPGGILVSDNVLQDGDIIESRYAVRRRDRTIHKRMREYLYCLTHSRELCTSVLTIGDGVAVSVRMETEEE